MIKSSCFTIFLGKQIIRSFVENRGRSPFQSLRDKLHAEKNTLLDTPEEKEAK